LGIEEKTVKTVQFSPGRRYTPLKQGVAWAFLFCAWPAGKDQEKQHQGTYKHDQEFAERERGIPLLFSAALHLTEMGIDAGGTTGVNFP
jgi:hypothetical protein